jgi:adenylylsulfate kinase-like enzyme
LGHSLAARRHGSADRATGVGLIAPLVDDRELLRKAHVQVELPFVEVFVDTSVEECERRDPKGLYARARAGEIKAFTGIDAPYEPPEHPEVHVPTSQMTAEAAVDEILEQL